MSGQHTQGRLVASGHILRATDGKGAIADTPEDARRLAACWNMCEGVETEAIETAMPLVERISTYANHLATSDHDRKEAFATVDGVMAELAAARALLRDVIKPHDDHVAAILAAGDMPVENPMAVRIRSFLKGDGDV